MLLPLASITFVVFEVRRECEQGRVVPGKVVLNLLLNFTRESAYSYCSLNLFCYGVFLGGCGGGGVRIN